jgi:hypothetical protein
VRWHSPAVVSLQEIRMAPTSPATAHQHWSSGRGYACTDPERQVEVLGYVRKAPIQTTPARSVAPAAPKAARKDWLRVQPDLEGGYEGSSSRRWR